MKNMPPNMRAIALVLFAFGAYNIGDAFLKEAQNFYSFAEAALYPVLFYGLFVVLASPKFGGLKKVTQTKKLKTHLIRAFFGTNCFIAVTISFQYITLAEAYTLLLSSPFWLALLSIFFFKEKVGLHRWAALIVGFAGVLIVLRPGIIPLELASVGVLWGAFAFAIFVIYTKKLGEDEPLINMVLYPIFTDILILVPIVIFMNGWNPPQLEHFILFMGAGLFYLIGTALCSIGYATGESSLLAPLQYSQIIWGALIGYFIFQEMPEAWTFTGAALIVLAGIYLIYRENKVQK